MSENTFTLKLSREELVCVLSILGARGIPGLGDDYFEKASEAEIRQVIMAGYNALCARELIEQQIDPKTSQPVVVLDRLLLAIVGTCLRAARVIFINRIPQGGPFIPWYIHLGPHLTVIHRYPQYALHEFFVTVDSKDIHVEIDRFMMLHPSAGCEETAPLKVQNQAYETAVQMAQQRQPDQAVLALAGAGMPSETAGLLTQAVSQLQAISTLSLIELDENGQSRLVDALALIQSPNQMWTLRGADQPEVELQMVTVERMRSLFHDWMKD